MDGDPVPGGPAVLRSHSLPRRLVRAPRSSPALPCLQDATDLSGTCLEPAGYMNY